MQKSGQLRELAERNAELARRLDLMEDRQHENDDLRQRLATLDALLLNATPALAGGKH